MWIANIGVVVMLLPIIFAIQKELLSTEYGSGTEMDSKPAEPKELADFSATGKMSSRPRGVILQRRLPPFFRSLPLPLPLLACYYICSQWTRLPPAWYSPSSMALQWEGWPPWSVLIQAWFSSSLWISKSIFWASSEIKVNMQDKYGTPDRYPVKRQWQYQVILIALFLVLPLPSHPVPISLIDSCPVRTHGGPQNITIFSLFTFRHFRERCHRSGLLSLDHSGIRLM